MSFHDDGNRAEFVAGDRVVIRHRREEWDGLRGTIVSREHDDPSGMLVIAIEDKPSRYYFDGRNVEREEGCDVIPRRWGTARPGEVL